MVSSDACTWSSRASSHTQVHGFYRGSEFLQPVIRHVGLTIVNRCFLKYSHACREPGHHPILFFPSSNFCPSLQWYKRTRFLSRWHCPNRISDPRRIARTALTHIPLCLWPSSLNSAVGQTLPIFSSNKIFFSHAAIVIGWI